MKICSLYGAGFYYIPGTDTCIKIGGFARADYVFNGAPSGAAPFIGGNDAHFNPNDTRYYDWRTRFMYSFDVRSQTEYGTLRSYVRGGWQFTTGGAPASSGDALVDDGVVYNERLFIQFAGFTFGKTASPFTFVMNQPMSNVAVLGTDDTGNGITVIGYTANLGNGIALDLSIEDPANFRRNELLVASGAQAPGLAFTTGAGATVTASQYAGTSVPDLVGTLSINQAWGSAMVGVLAHQIRGKYYGETIFGGRPDDKWGYAAKAGVNILLPMLAPGSRLMAEVTYTEGVLGTVFKNGPSNIGIYDVPGVNPAAGGSVAPGFVVDAVRAVAPGSQWNLTKAWGAFLGLEHYWIPAKLRTSLYGTYTNVDYSGSSTTAGDAANSVCIALFGGVGAPGAGGACNPDLKIWQIGSRTVWTVVPNLDLSVEGLYTYIDQGSSGTLTTAAAQSSIPAGTVVNVEDKGVWSFNVRAQRNFWP